MSDRRSWRRWLYVNLHPPAWHRRGLSPLNRLVVLVIILAVGLAILQSEPWEGSQIDEEQVFLHAQKNLDIRVLNDRFEWIGRNRHLVVKASKLEHVHNNRHEIVENDHKEQIKKDRNVEVSGKEAVKITGSKSLTVDADVI